MGILHRAADVLSQASQVVGAEAGELADVGPVRSRRRSWQRGGHAHIEVLPRAARLPVTLLEAQPRVRAEVQARIGKLPAELLFWLASSAASVSTADPLPQAVDSVQRALALLEARSRRLAWERRQQELSAPGRDGAGPAAAPAEPCPAEPSTAPPARPVPLPPGPVERAAERTSLGALGVAGGLLAATRDPGRAADLLLATVPRAARLGREAFAAMLATSWGTPGSCRWTRRRCGGWTGSAQSSSIPPC